MLLKQIETEMLGLLLRGFFLLGIISVYSTGVWKFINEYFLGEFKTYLGEEFKRNKHLKLVEVPTKLPPSVATTEAPMALSPDEAKPLINVDGEVETCERRDMCQRSSQEEELDYGNHRQTTTVDDRQSQSNEDELIKYWQERRSNDNSDHNLYCQPEETTCEGNS